LLSGDITKIKKQGKSKKLISNGRKIH